ncbi:hypothetical protein T11_4920 [Trichinella zimbabwensis]|uniref:Uncharacterized protein n=1 Tax=Trichinella zimbabwensis TaxID=268475 RepID=A0A0V1HUW1_9BILA|nr:hypothetical protein T11_4920 [Trichinella zimbabwensis]
MRPSVVGLYYSWLWLTQQQSDEIKHKVECCKKNKQKGRPTFVPLFRCWRRASLLATATSI